MYTHTQIFKHNNKYANTQIHPYTHKRKNKYTHTHTHTHKHTRTHTHTHTHAHEHAHSQEEELKASNTGPQAKGKKAAGKAVLKKKAANKRRKSWNGSDMSESESDAADDDDDSDDEFVASKAKKGKAAPKQAAKRPRDDGPATTVQWIAPPKAAILAPIARKEPVAKKQVCSYLYVCARFRHVFGTTLAMSSSRQKDGFCACSLPGRKDSYSICFGLHLPSTNSTQPPPSRHYALFSQDVKDTPDKTAFKSTKVNNDSDSEGEGGMSLFERLNAKVGGSGETKKLFSAPVPKVGEVQYNYDAV